MEKIIKLAPSYKDYLWGGTKLREDYGKSSTCEKVAESWEISCHPDGPSFIAEGEQEGMPLEDYIAEHREAILGEQGSRYASFPICANLLMQNKSCRYRYIRMMLMRKRQGWIMERQSFGIL